MKSIRTAIRIVVFVWSITATGMILMLIYKNPGILSYYIKPPIGLSTANVRDTPREEGPQSINKLTHALGEEVPQSFGEVTHTSMTGGQRIRVTSSEDGPQRVDNEIHASRQDGPQRVEKVTHASRQDDPQRVDKVTHASRQDDPQRVDKVTHVRIQDDPQRVDKVTHAWRQDVPKRVDMVTHAPSEQCEKRLPAAIVIGIQKAGTTALLHFLMDHPQIATAMKGLGEPNYFTHHYDKPLEWYRQLMPCSYSNQITLEKSPQYFYAHPCPERIQKLDPNMKIIIIVKEPIERTLSMYAMLVALNDDLVRDQSFEEAIMTNNLTIINQQTKLITYSDYSRHMRHWLDVFNRNQILTIDGQNFLKDPSFELTKVENFLQVGNYFTPERFVFNTTKQMHCIIRSGVPSCMGSGKGRLHSEISTDVRLKLQRYFKPKNEMFFDMIGRRFEWGY